jgi:hypothetical protein
MKMTDTIGERQFGIVGYLGTSTLSPSPPKRKILDGLSCDLERNHPHFERDLNEMVTSDRRDTAIWNHYKAVQKHG